MQKAINLTALIQSPADELKELQHLFHASFRRAITKNRKDSEVPSSLMICSVKRIQNALNWLDYRRRQTKVRTELEALRNAGRELNTKVVDLKTRGHFVDLEDEETNTVLLFHGTSFQAADAIAKEDFHISRSGSNRGALFGKGIYLAESCTKADEYGKEGPDHLRCMLACRVTLGNVLYCDDVSPDVAKLERACMGAYHSVLGDREKVHGTFREFIVYDEDQVYPEFVITYTREFGKM